MSKNLTAAYTLNSKDDTINLYKYWSKTYDQDFAIDCNYKSPQKVVKYFLKYSKKTDIPILDVGAGTGLIAEYLTKIKLLKIHAIDLSKEMLNQARKKRCYEKIIIADLNKKLKVKDNSYGAVLSAGTFTHGHLGPSVLEELLRIVIPGGLFVITIHNDIFIKGGFKKKFEILGNRINSLKIHKVNIYGKIATNQKNSDKVLITIFRKSY